MSNTAALQLALPLTPPLEDCCESCGHVLLGNVGKCPICYCYCCPSCYTMGDDRCRSCEDA